MGVFNIPQRKKENAPRYNKKVNGNRTNENVQAPRSVEGGTAQGKGRGAKAVQFEAEEVV